MRVAINGQHADSVETVGWRFITGSRPNIQEYHMDRTEADALLKFGGNASITIEDGGQRRTISGLSIIGEAPSSSPLWKAVLVADLRWKWSRKHVLGRYNIRRRTGQKTLVIDGQLEELGLAIDDFKFAPWSLNGSAKWKPKEMVANVFDKLQTVGQFEYEIDKSVLDEVEINDVDIDDPGPEAVDIAMRHLAGAALWVNDEGKVIVQSSIDGSEAGVVTSSGPEIKDGGHAEKISFAFTRPAKIRVLFTREQEIRVDTRTEGEGTQAEMVDEREMENVVVVTDPNVTVNGGLVGRGSWLTFNEIFPYWNTTKSVAGAFDFSHDLIQAAFFEDRLYNIHLAWNTLFDADPVAVGRIGAIKTHYRQTYRINRRWMDRIYTIKDYRASLLDPTTGTRGRAQVYSDYCVKLSSRHVDPDPNRQSLYFNVTGYAASLVDGQVSPAIIDIVDDQVGIIHFNYITDPYGVHKEIYPSRMDNIPTANLADQNPRGLGIRVGQFGAVPRLSSGNRAAAVLTAIPAAPNDNTQFYAIEIKPEDVNDLLGGAKIDPATGPTWEIRVHPGLLTARMAWFDSLSNVIERSFGIGISNDPQIADQQAQADSEAIKGVIVNTEDLTQVARALAAQLWSKMTDRYLGSKSVRNLNIQLKGAMDSLVYTIDANGRVIGKISIMDQLRERSIFAMLPEGVRRTVLREVVP